jgi:hypothetical protein
MLVTSHATGDAPVKNNTKTQSADQRFELVINQRAIKQQVLTAILRLKLSLRVN